MDPEVVVDASVWVSRFIRQDAYHVPSREWLMHYTGSGGRLIMPTLVLSEVAGPVSRRSGRSDLGQQAVQEMLTLFSLQLVPLTVLLGRVAAQTAAFTQLRGADAIYVALAQSLNIPLLTWDAEQQQRTVGHITTYTPASYVF